SEIATATQARVELEQQAAAAHEQLASLRQERDQKMQAVSERKSELATLEERRRSAESALQRIGHLASEMQARVDSLVSQIESAASEKGQRETENLEIAEKLVNLDAERNACDLRA